MPIRIYLNHVVEDRDRVRELYDKLVKAGFEPWFDEERILPGENRVSAIERAISASDVCLAVFSKFREQNFGKNKQDRELLRIIQKEINQKIHVIPVRFNVCRLPH